ncbi:MAG: alpha/beta hydrolase [Acidimicrobiales bacterium]|nr:alpha/beta hydrolase [Acidimicrobiales bacterium]
MPAEARTVQKSPVDDAQRRTISLTTGTIEYTDTGGDGPTIVFLHGLLMDRSLWGAVIAELSPGNRCIAPTLPLGAHREAMTPDADLSLEGIATLVGQLLDELDLRDATVAGVDTGGALLQLLMARREPRLARAILISCDAFDNFPPGLTGKTLVAAGKLPPTLFNFFMQHLRFRPIRRSPLAFGWLTKRGDRATQLWLEPVLKQPEIRRDTLRVLRAITANRKLLLDTAEHLPSFDRPSLVIWAERDRVMPPEHGERLAGLLPQSRLVVLADSRTLIPLDQPTRLAQHINSFMCA